MMPFTRQHRIAIVWELGGGMGHAARLAPLIEALIASGSLISVVARNPRRIYEALGDGTRDSKALSYYRAPVLPARPEFGGGGRVCSTMADILAADGFASPISLTAYLREWQNLLGSLAPSLVISDFAPFANLVAAKMAPLLVVGSGYTIPPEGNHPFRGRPLASKTAENHNRLLAAIDQAAREVDAVVPESIGHAFRGAANFPLTVPFLDPYQGNRVEAVLPPYTLSTLAGARSPAPSVRTGVFAYLPASHDGLRTVADVLSDFGSPASIYAPGSPEVNHPPGPAIQWLDHPADMATTLPGTRAVIHSGGLGLAHACLAAGVPQIVLPTYVEQDLTAAALAREGVALTIGRAMRSNLMLFRDALANALHNPGLAQRSAQLATSFPRKSDASLGAVLSSVMGLLR